MLNLPTAFLCRGKCVASIKGLWSCNYIRVCLLDVLANDAFFPLNLFLDCGRCIASAFCRQKGYSDTPEVIGSPVPKSLWDGTTSLLRNLLSFPCVEYGFLMSGSSLVPLHHAVDTSHPLLHLIEDCGTGLVLSTSPPLPNSKFLCRFSSQEGRNSDSGETWMISVPVAWAF